MIYWIKWQTRVVEYRLAKARVAGSNPVSCFFCCRNFLDFELSTIE